MTCVLQLLKVRCYDTQLLISIRQSGISRVNEGSTADKYDVIHKTRSAWSSEEDRARECLSGPICLDFIFCIFVTFIVFLCN